MDNKNELVVAKFRGAERGIHSPEAEGLEHVPLKVDLRAMAKKASERNKPEALWENEEINLDKRQGSGGEAETLTFTPLEIKAVRTQTETQLELLKTIKDDDSFRNIEEVLSIVVDEDWGEGPLAQTWSEAKRDIDGVAGNRFARSGRAEKIKAIEAAEKIIKEREYLIVQAFLEEATNKDMLGWVKDTELGQVQISLVKGGSRDTLDMTDIIYVLAQGDKDNSPLIYRYGEVVRKAKLRTLERMMWKHMDIKSAVTESEFKGMASVVTTADILKFSQDKRFKKFLNASVCYPGRNRRTFKPEKPSNFKIWKKMREFAIANNYAPSDLRDAYIFLRATSASSFLGWSFEKIRDVEDYYAKREATSVGKVINFGDFDEQLEGEESGYGLYVREKVMDFVQQTSAWGMYIYGFINRAGGLYKTRDAQGSSKDVKIPGIPQCARQQDELFKQYVEEPPIYEDTVELLEYGGNDPTIIREQEKMMKVLSATYGKKPEEIVRWIKGRELEREQLRWVYTRWNLAPIKSRYKVQLGPMGQTPMPFDTRGKKGEILSEHMSGLVDFLNNDQLPARRILDEAGIGRVNERMVNGLFEQRVLEEVKAFKQRYWSSRGRGSDETFANNAEIPAEDVRRGRALADGSDLGLSPEAKLELLLEQDSTWGMKLEWGSEPLNRRLDQASKNNDLPITMTVVYFFEYANKVYGNILGLLTYFRQVWLGRETNWMKKDAQSFERLGVRPEADRIDGHEAAERRRNWSYQGQKKMAGDDDLTLRNQFKVADLIKGMKDVWKHIGYQQEAQFSQPERAAQNFFNWAERQDIRRNIEERAGVTHKYINEAEARGLNREGFNLMGDMGHRGRNPEAFKEMLERKAKEETIHLHLELDLTMWEDMIQKNIIQPGEILQMIYQNQMFWFEVPVLTDEEIKSLAADQGALLRLDYVDRQILPQDHPNFLHMRDAITAQIYIEGSRLLEGQLEMFSVDKLRANFDGLTAFADQGGMQPLVLEADGVRNGLSIQMQLQSYAYKARTERVDYVNDYSGGTVVQQPRYIRDHMWEEVEGRRPYLPEHVVLLARMHYGVDDLRNVQRTNEQRGVNFTEALKKAIEHLDDDNLLRHSMGVTLSDLNVGLANTYKAYHKKIVAKMAKIRARELTNFQPIPEIEYDNDLGERVILRRVEVEEMTRAYAKRIERNPIYGPPGVEEIDKTRYHQSVARHLHLSPNTENPGKEIGETMYRLVELWVEINKAKRSGGGDRAAYNAASDYLSQCPWLVDFMAEYVATFEGEVTDPRTGQRVSINLESLKENSMVRAAGAEIVNQLISLGSKKEMAGMVRAIIGQMYLVDIGSDIGGMKEEVLGTDLFGHIKKGMENNSNLRSMDSYVDYLRNESMNHRRIVEKNKSVLKGLRMADRGKGRWGYARSAEDLARAWSRVDTRLRMGKMVSYRKAGIVWRALMIAMAENYKYFTDKIERMRSDGYGASFEQLLEFYEKAIEPKAEPQTTMEIASPDNEFSQEIEAAKTLPEQIRALTGERVDNVFLAQLMGLEIGETGDLRDIYNKVLAIDIASGWRRFQMSQMYEHDEAVTGPLKWLLERFKIKVWPHGTPELLIALQPNKLSTKLFLGVSGVSALAVMGTYLFQTIGLGHTVVEASAAVRLLAESGLLNLAASPSSFFEALKGVSDGFSMVKDWTVFNPIGGLLGGGWEAIKATGGFLLSNIGRWVVFGWPVTAGSNLYMYLRRTRAKSPEARARFISRREYRAKKKREKK